MLIMLAAGAYVGWNSGANDTANCVGTSIGCGLLSFRRALLLVGAFTFLGAVLQGEHVMKTIGSGIVQGKMGCFPAAVAMICSGFFVTLATFFRIPTSTSQAIVGGMLGIGLAMDVPVNKDVLIAIGRSWLLCPLLVAAASFGIYFLLCRILRRVKYRAMLAQNLLGKLAILASCYVAYSMGANNAGNAMGPIAGLDIMPPWALRAVAGAAIALGALTYGKKVSMTVGKGITPLDIPGAFAAQMAAAIGLHSFAIMGIPVPTSSAIVGAVIGVGLVKGITSISKKTIGVIMMGWVATPLCAAFTSYFMYNILSRLVDG